jgi:hypothetical protein
LENNSPESLLNIWKKGKPLKDAIWSFCDKQYIQELPKNNNDRQMVKQNPGWQDFANEINKSARALIEIQNARDKLYSNLYEKIKKGHLTALGYEAPVKSKDYPVEVPLHMWPPETIDIIKSSISGNGLNFLSVRIVKKSAFKVKIKSKNKIIKETVLPRIKPIDKRIGRPTLKEQIIVAYSRLKKERRIDYSKTLKSHTQLIQKTVQILFSEVKSTAGMENEAIRRAIGDIFKADKKNSKPTSKL